MRNWHLYYLHSISENQMNLTNMSLRQTVPFLRGQDFLNWKSGILLLLAWIINLSLGYELGVLDIVGFFCLLCLLERVSWRAFKYMLLASSVLAACYFPFGRTYGAPNFNSVLSLYSSNPAEAGDFVQ